ncbi:MAG: VWA domain-containing protein [Acidobacteria bacterium]|nr:VWA domain-containing protein [Acidobacteriota bacterium]
MIRLYRRALFIALLFILSVGVAAWLRASAQQKRPTRPADDDEVVRVETDLTNILFTAIDKDRRYVTTLRKEDVRVFENDTPQEVFTFQRETELPLSLAILIDTSWSQEETLPDEKAAARAFVDAVIRPEKDQAAIISFTGKPTIEQPLTGDLSSLQKGIEQVIVIHPRDPEEGGAVATAEERAEPDYDDSIGYTNIWDSLSFASNEVLSQTHARTRRAIILLTDGNDTNSRLKKEEAIERAVKANVVIYSIGIVGDRQSVEKETLRRISEKTGGRAFFPDEENDLHAAFKQIEQELRAQYLLAYTPSNAARDGSYRRIRLEITNPELRKRKLRLLYREGYYARQK